MFARANRDSLAFLAVWTAYAALVRRFWWVCDDAFISFRYGRNWAEGLGLRYNPGDHVPVEGYSNFGWVAISAGVHRLGGDPTFWMPLISFVCGSLLLWRIFVFLRRRLELSLPVTTLATGTLALFPPFAVWSTGGLATMPVCLAMFVAFERITAPSPDRRAGIRAAVQAGGAGLALALLRFDGIGAAAAIAVAGGIAARLRGERAGRRVGLYALIVGVGFLVYYAWRTNYHGQWFPNTAVAKSGTSLEFFARGARSVVSHFLAFPGQALYLAGIPLALARDRRALGAPLVGALLGPIAYALAIGGDYMVMGRYLVPVAIFGTALLGGWMGYLSVRPGRRLAVPAVAAVFVGLTLPPAFDVNPVPESVRARLGYRSDEDFRSDFEIWRLAGLRNEVWSELGRLLGTHTNRGESLARGTIGRVGYYSDLHILDQYGLVTPEVAERTTEALEWGPGHDRRVSRTWFLDRRPTYLDAQLVKSVRPAFAIARSLEKWWGWGVADLYAPEVLDVGPDAPRGPDRYLVLLRLSPTPELATARWEEARRAVREIDPKIVISPRSPETPSPRRTARSR